MTDSAQPHVSLDDITAAARLAALTFTDAERDLMLEAVQHKAAQYEAGRGIPLPNSAPPAFVFSPLVEGMSLDLTRRPAQPSVTEAEPPPANLEDAAFAPVTTLSYWLRTRQVTSSALTEMYLARLKRYGPLLECVVTLTEDRAIAQARQADEEITAGRYRGPLHGVPWGCKDLLSVAGYPTTWGAPPYREQTFAADAAVVDRLDEAGAVLLAKLTVGSLAWGDIWFGGMTRNPWNRQEGANGSSAGSAAATAAGLVGFAIGTETLGSIVSPSTRCGVTGLRPTFGRVSRHGVMALAWTMDKIGPMCRTVEDCALVFDAIYGPDGRDVSVVDAGFVWEPAVRISDQRVGYVAEAFSHDYPARANDERTLDTLRGLGVQLVPIELPDFPVSAMSNTILMTEAAAAFDELTRSDRDDLLVRQGKDGWPNKFRAARLVPAVEYIQAQRLRTQLMQAMAEVVRDLDVYVAPSFYTFNQDGRNNLQITNLTGHPAVIVPNGFTDAGAPTSITFTGRLYQEARLLAAAKAFQDATDYHRQYPAL